MPEKALPCIVCGKELDNVDREAVNQPHSGLAFTFVTHGHYGGTVFDPMDGQFIEINVCDECLVTAGEEKKVLLNRDVRLVLCGGVIVGHQKVKREYLQWKKGVDGGTDIEVDCLRVNENEVGTDIEDVTWH